MGSTIQTLRKIEELQADNLQLRESVAKLESKLEQVEVKPCEYFAAQVADCLGFNDVPKLMGPYLRRACEVVAKVVDFEKQNDLLKGQVKGASAVARIHQARVKELESAIKVVIESASPMAHMGQSWFTVSKEGIEWLRRALRDSKETGKGKVVGD